MKDTPSHLQALEEIERDGIPGLVEVLREAGYRRCARLRRSWPSRSKTTSGRWAGCISNSGLLSVV